MILYELLTGSKPHQGESPIQVAYKHVHEDVPPPSHLVPGIPAYVDALVARATARDRELRPADARVLLHQLRRVRAALDHGVVDDPELTADLTPTIPVFLHDDIDYVTEDAPTILTPRVAAGGRAEDTSVIQAATPVAAAPASGPPARRTPVAPGRRSRRGPILLVLVLLLAILAGVGGWYFGMGRYTSTPGVIQLTSAQAKEKVEAAGLEYVEAGTAFSETVPAGSVMSTDPEAGSRILKDGTVEATISKGPERYDVPPMRGMTLDAAQAELQDASLAFGEATRRYDERVAKGIVLASNPKAGKELRRGTAVDLVVSRGPAPIDIPDFTGEDAAQAEQELTDLGFKVETTEENHDTVAEGDVISQSPSSGTANRGDTIDLVVSKGPVLVEVPEVTSMGIEEATKAIEAVGLRVETERSNLYVGLGYVVGQDPGADQMVPKGTVVSLSLV